jgi:hypothetical protein
MSVLFTHHGMLNDYRVVTVPAREVPKGFHYDVGDGSLMISGDAPASMITKAIKALTKHEMSVVASTSSAGLVQALANGDVHLAGNDEQDH